MTSRRCGRADDLRADALPARTPKGRRLRAGPEDLPHRDRARAGGHGEVPTPRPSRLPRNLVGLKVMVVDDDDATLDYFAFVLRTCGADVMLASNARDALRVVPEQRPDVVLSDIAMVGEDGYWLVREMRELTDETARVVPVVATTAYDREHSRDRALAAGFHEFLPKPVDPDVLCRAIATAAAR